MTWRDRLFWILCQLGVSRACVRVSIEDQNPTIEELRERQLETQRRLQYLGYYVDSYTGVVDRATEDAEHEY